MAFASPPLPVCAASPASDWQTRWVTGSGALSELALEWASLDNYARSPIDQYAWACAAASALAHDRELQVATVWQGSRLAAAAALVVQQRGPARRASLVGVAELQEPMDLVCDEPAALDELTRQLVEWGCPLKLERLSASSPTLAAVSRACRGRASVVVRPQPACPFIPLDDSWREPEQHLNAGRRSDMRRARRRAESMGDVVTEILAPRPWELGALLDEALRIEASSWKGASGSSLACDGTRASFYRRYASTASRLGILRLCYLRIGGEAAAMQLAIQTCGGFWLLKIGYDERFGRCSPGLLLMRDTIAAAAADGLSSYEFLGKTDAWTDVWTQHVREQVSLRVYPWHCGGLTTFTSDAVGMVRNRWRQQ